MVSPYHLLTYPNESGVGKSHAIPPGCTSQGKQTEAPPVPLCQRGQLTAPPFLLLPKATSLWQKESKNDIRMKS